MPLSRRGLLKGAFGLAAAAIVAPPNLVEAASGLLLPQTRVVTAEGFCLRCARPIEVITAYNYVVPGPNDAAQLWCLDCIEAGATPRIIYALDRTMQYNPAKWEIRTRATFGDDEVAIAHYLPTGHHFTYRRALYQELVGTERDYGVGVIRYSQPVALDAAERIPAFAKAHGLA